MILETRMYTSRKDVKENWIVYSRSATSAVSAKVMIRAKKKALAGARANQEQNRLRGSLVFQDDGGRRLFHLLLFDLFPGDHDGAAALVIVVLEIEFEVFHVLLEFLFPVLA